MKKLLYILLLFGCSQKDSLESETASVQVNNVYQASNTKENGASVESARSKDFGKFLSLFRFITFDTLHIYNNDEGGNRTLIEKAIPTKYLTYFPEPIKLGATDWNVDSVYAVYKFAYSPTITALIARVPSQHSSSAFNLFLFSNKSQKLLHSQRIAEFTGDGGDVYTEQSWLLNLNDDNFIDIVTKSKDVYALDEDLTKFTQYDSSLVYLGTDSSFSKSFKYLDKAKVFKLKERN